MRSIFQIVFLFAAIQVAEAQAAGAQIASGDTFYSTHQDFTVAPRQGYVFEYPRPLELAKNSTEVAVDVVLGYTSGFVVLHGGVTQANARLQQLVDITNQAYANSGVVHRIRLVHTVQVNYTDTNANEIALEQLTGLSCDSMGCAPISVPAELVPLRNAREQYSADLVALVRRNRAPQQINCGQAWLLGEGGLTIDATNAPLGYALVSDGSDVNEEDGRPVICREAQLAHELGHNMGQAHNIEDSSGTGTHPYAYGYREATTTGFYTVMAMPLADSSQYAIPYFSNPDVNDPASSRPTGTASANNAASLNLTMPIVALFRGGAGELLCNGFEAE